MVMLPTLTVTTCRKPPETIDPHYDTIPYSDPAQVQTNERAQIYERDHSYEKIYAEVQPTEQSSKHATVDKDKK